MVIRLIGPGGAGKSSTGAMLGKHLGVHFLDLDCAFIDRFGEVGGYIDRHGYEVYARENVSTYLSTLRSRNDLGVLALSSGFMSYPEDVHPGYLQARTEIEQGNATFVLLPSLELEACVAEIVRRQIERPFGRSPAREEAVIRERFPIYFSMPVRRVQTMRPITEVVDDIVGALQPNTVMQTDGGFAAAADRQNR